MKKMKKLIAAVLCSITILIFPLNVYADFPDVSSDSWYGSSVEQMEANGLIKGYGNGTFGPGNNMTRSEFATIIWRMLGSRSCEYEDDFFDVYASSWYAQPVLWASREEVGIINGYATGYFGPDDCVTREQIAVMLYRTANYSGKDISGAADLSRFLDSNKVSGYAQNGMKWAVSQGIITGKNGGTLLDPTGRATRAEVAVMVSRYLGYAAATAPKSLGEQIVEYACQFEGCPYLYGGNSLTNGTDCSGFVNLVYKNFGYSLYRQSTEIRKNGREVSLEEMQPGDILCYSGHVAIYAGNGCIIHAANEERGIVYDHTIMQEGIITIRRII